MGDGARNRRDYFAAYYEENQGQLSEKRRDKYASDPEYRERAKEAARRYRAKRREERERLRAEGKLPPARQTGPRKPVKVEINEVLLDAYTITVAAQKIGRSVDTMNHWSKIGALPVTPIRSKRGDRLYTDGMIRVIREAVQKRGEVSIKDATFYREIMEGWAQLGVNVY